MTPRHFQFDPSGQWLLAANQDTDRVGVFQFNMQSGTLNWTGNYHNIQSPNFIMAVEPHQYIECTGIVDDVEALVRSEVNNSLTIVNFFHNIQNFRQISDLFSQI